HSGPNGWKIRAILAAMGSPSYGIYSGYEFVESEPRGSFEEMNNNEKYEYRPRDYSRDPYGIQGLLTRLNEIRKEHVALQRL
ncbi:alpha-1,4-glucan--maltose-1-phosphate maltosyltransferase, partial [Bifidobacterium bifidum]|nr:alpha-1,4-glucan--maltose-1-phosphate maltosyltransferase [Bifidobacterium bifidum]